MVLEIQDPVLPGQPLRLECGVDGPRREDAAAAGQDGGRRRPGSTASSSRTASASKIELQNADQRIVVRVDGKEVARVDYEVIPVDSPAMDRDAPVERGRAVGDRGLRRLGSRAGPPLHASSTA